MEINQKFGNQLKKLRLEKGLTQEELATKSGFHRTYAGNIERGLENPTLQAIAQLADVLDISVKELFEFEETQERKDWSGISLNTF